MQYVEVRSCVDEMGRTTISGQVLTKDEARRIAANIAKSLGGSRGVR
jgi:hypothetical protein